LIAIFIVVFFVVFSIFSFGANLAIYINKTIIPPKKIKKRINENQGVLNIIHIIMQILRVCKIIITVLNIGLKVVENMVLSKIEKIIIAFIQDLFY
jgi:hypothetical protein